MVNVFLGGVFVGGIIAAFSLIPNLPLYLQALKLKTIVRGDAPTSLVTTGLCRKEVSANGHIINTYISRIMCDMWLYSKVMIFKP